MQNSQRLLLYHSCILSHLDSSCSATVNLYSLSYPTLRFFSAMCSISYLRTYLSEPLNTPYLLATICIYIYFSVDSHSLRLLQKRLRTLHVPSNCKWEIVNRFLTVKTLNVLNADRFTFHECHRFSKSLTIFFLSRLTLYIPWIVINCLNTF